ncbi:hypothetical protein COO60DRAFT_1487314, partial [Scenedesmus sp. NREL 46B-D3]
MYCMLVPSLLTFHSLEVTWVTSKIQPEVWGRSDGWKQLQRWLCALPWSFKFKKCLQGQQSMEVQYIQHGGSTANSAHKVVGTSQHSQCTVIKRPTSNTSLAFHTTKAQPSASQLQRDGDKTVAEGHDTNMHSTVHTPPAPPAARKQAWRRVQLGTQQHQSRQPTTANCKHQAHCTHARHASTAGHPLCLQLAVSMHKQQPADIQDWSPGAV